MAAAGACATSPTPAAPRRHASHVTAAAPPRPGYVAARRRTGGPRIACRCRAVSTGAAAGDEGCGGRFDDWDWNQWNRHFAEIDQAESEISVLKFELEEAIENEEFTEAAKLKLAVAEATSKDSVAVIMSELKKAIEEQRYRDASKLSQLGRTALIGWWVGCAKDPDDTFGKIIRITPSVGRYEARSYSPRQLITESPGTPLFEMFLLHNDDGAYGLKAVFLQATKGSASVQSPSLSTMMRNPAEVEGEEESSIGNATTKNLRTEDGHIADGTSEDNADIKEVSDKGVDTPTAKGSSVEGLKNIFSYFKARIPDFKVQVPNNRPDDSKNETETPEQLEENDGKTNASAKNSISEAGSSEVQQGSLPVDAGLESSSEGDSAAIKLFIGGILHNKEEISSRSYVRIPAEIRSLQKDSFELFIPGKSSDRDLEEVKAARMKVAAIAAKLASELMPPEVAKAFSNADSDPVPKKDMQELLKLAVSKAYRRDTITETTVFRRIVTENSDLDPFNGLYIGSFGPYGPEVVQLRRKYGYWNDKDDVNSNIEFVEYVEAIKLTGHQNVPAGQVTFRAKITKGSRLLNRGSYPEEFGVVASYKGQGRIADPDFKNPRWVDGELLQLNGKGALPHLRGVHLGFLYSVPEHSFLVLFNRLKLPE